MAQKQTKTYFRLWTVADFETEEAFLREQHKQGWGFVKYVLPGFYTFEACTPEDVIYQLDFTDTGCSAHSTYLQMFSDYGWEYVQSVNGFSYFRKPAAAHEPEDLTIFSDTQSKIDMIVKITKRRLIPSLLIFLTCVLPYVMHSQFDGLWVFFAAMFVLYIILMTHIAITLSKIKKKYQKGL